MEDKVTQRRKEVLNVLSEMGLLSEDMIAAAVEGRNGDLLLAVEESLPSLPRLAALLCDLIWEG